MGCGVSQNQQHVLDKEQIRIHRRIEEQINRDKLNDLTVIKVLLLGGSASGKTTIFKQMRILHLDGFTDSDHVNFRYIIASNAILAMKQLLEALKQLNIQLQKPLLTEANRFIKFVETEDVGNYELNEEIGLTISELWNSKPVQVAFRHRWKFNFPECTKLYLDEILRLSAADYRATTQDILLCRFRTTGINEMDFQFRDVTLKMVDVGGQKSEQKKWLHCFDNVHMLLFVASLTDYDLMLDEDPNINRMVHSIEIWSKLCSSPYFVETAFILFLNKKDVFAEKILNCPLTACFPAFKGSNSLEICGTYILERFLEHFSDVNQQRLYAHYTTATDTNNVQRVFNNCMDQVLRQNMTNAGVA